MLLFHKICWQEEGHGSKAIGNKEQVDENGREVASSSYDTFK